MKTYNVFKLNIADKGYTHEPSKDFPSFDLRTIDEALPPVQITNYDQPSINPYFSPVLVAYSATRLRDNQILAAVGSHWPQHKDQYKRSGLSFWHGILCDLPKFDEQQVLAIANLLVGLTQRYEVNYLEIGKLVENWAMERPVDNWGKPLASLLAQKVPDQITDEAERIIRAFWVIQDQLPNRANLRVSFPFHAHLAIPCLLSLMLFRAEVRQIAGGMLAESDLSRFQHLSIPVNVPEYSLVDLSTLLSSRKAPVNVSEHTPVDPSTSLSSRRDGGWLKSITSRATRLWSRFNLGRFSLVFFALVMGLLISCVILTLRYLV